MLAIIIVIVTVALDQISKALVVSNMEFHGETINVLGSVLQFWRTENNGAAFGMLGDNRWVFMLFSFVAIGIGIYCLVKFYRRHILLTISVAMLLGGGIGNMIDRLFRAGEVYEKAVVDFIYSSLMPWFHFNLADAFITVGAVILCVYIIFFESKIEKQLAEAKKSKENQETQEDASSEGE